MPFAYERHLGNSVAFKGAAVQATAWQCGNRELRRIYQADVSSDRVCQIPTQTMGYLKRELVNKVSRPCVPHSQPCTCLYI